MSVIFGFQAFTDKNSEPVDSIDDYGKRLTNEIFQTVPECLEKLSEYGDSDSHIHGYYEYLKKMAVFGFTEEDFDFIMNTDGSQYDGTECTLFFDAQETHNKFIKLTNYFKQYETKKVCSRLFNIDTNEFILNAIMLNGNHRSYDMYSKKEFQKQISTVSSVIWNQGQPSVGEALNCKIVDLTIYEYCKKDIDDFSNFFLKHSKENHLIQGYWS